MWRVLCGAILLMAVVSACASSTISSPIVGTWGLVSTRTNQPGIPTKATFKNTGAVELLVSGAKKSGTWKEIDRSHVEVNMGVTSVTEKFVISGKHLHLYSQGGVKSLYVRKSG